MVACIVLDPFNYDVQFAKSWPKKIHSSTESAIREAAMQGFVASKAQRLRKPARSAAASSSRR